MLPKDNPFIRRRGRDRLAMVTCRLAFFAAIVLLGLECLAPASAASPTDLALTQQTAQDQIALRRTSYNYAPAVIHDGATTHLYWCGGVAGDFILHAQASSPDGPWHAADDAASGFDVALQPTGNPATFDGRHTCDPNVVKLGATFFLYYGGEAADGALTAIGVAASRDGVHFSRLNDGRPIVTAAETNPGYAAARLTYGAGQPAAAFVAPYLYLSFTDSTGSGVNKGNGAGQLALRSKDPSFAGGIEELTATGWQPRAPGRHTAEYSYLESFGMDWSFDKPSGLLIAASDRVAGHVTLFAIDPNTLKTLGTGDLAMTWKEGPALLAEADKTTAPRADCGKLPVTVFSAQGASADPFSWHALGLSRGVFAMTALCAPRKD